MPFPVRLNKPSSRAVFQRKFKRVDPRASRATGAMDETTAFAGGNDIFIPMLFTTMPPIVDELSTNTSKLQQKTVEECLPFLNGEEHPNKCNQHGVPQLDRQNHAQFLHKQLGNFPPQYLAIDASRPWWFYWCLAALSLIGEDVSVYKDRMVETARPLQNPGGGFGGGFGQMSHLATSYATVLALMLVGGEESYEMIDRRTMWKWLCSLKQPDGGFQMAVGGEEDVRGAYCAAVIVSLLNLPLELSQDSPAYAAGRRSLFDGLGEWVGKCQTLEGGMSSMPGLEAHGAYTFCALGCLAILDAPPRSMPRYLNVRRLASWLSSRQYAPEGGFGGRTNKLVDGCYSHWIGGCWPLVEAALNGPPAEAANSSSDHKVDVDSMYSRDGLIRYILCCCQDMSKRGGLRDKPSKLSDAYHTCYVLTGLSSAQHQWRLSSSRPEGSTIDTDEWTVLPYLEGEQIFDEEDRIGTAHPVYVIPKHKVDDARNYFGAKLGF